MATPPREGSRCDESFACDSGLRTREPRVKVRAVQLNRKEEQMRRRLLGYCGMLLAIAVLVAKLHAGEVTGLTLINAETDQAVSQLNDGDTIDLAKVGGELNVRADVQGGVGSVRFAYDKQGNHRTESTAPFAMAGDTKGNYGSWTPSPGKHTIVATPFSKPRAGGEKGQPFSVSLTVVGEAKAVFAPIEYPVLEDESAFKEMAVPPQMLDINGELRKWHRITLTFDGPETSETSTPNPFLDYRLNVLFRQGERTYLVPGYYAADGNAAQTGAASGNKWRVHFAPDATGTWTYAVSFRGGNRIAVNDDPKAGVPIRALDGFDGSFDVAPTDKTGRDHRGKGRLQYVGKRYLRFAETGEFFLKQGADAPENLLAYADFDGDFKTDGHKDHFIKTWQAHAGDWRFGDPTWQDVKGKGMIGAVNYLAGQGMNVFSFLTLNIEGDDGNVFPYLNYDERYRMDVSRLDQWEIVFEHGDRVGMYLHFKTSETENELLLDHGDTNVQRKLYYRELVARFAHHLALNWNLGEENGSLGRHNQSTPQRKAMAKYLHDHDPYGHMIVIHNGRQPDDLLGDESVLTGYSLQTNRPDFGNVHGQIVRWIQKSVDAGKPWVVACDEPGDASHSLITDGVDPEHNDARMNGLWGCLLGGGAGNEWYFGYKHPHSDLTCQDWRSRDLWWDQCRIALEFFHTYLPFTEMANHDSLTTDPDDYCFAKPSEVYAIMLRPGSTTALDLGDADATFDVRWFNPRTGGQLQTGSTKTIQGPGEKSLGVPPCDSDKDWIILVTKFEG